VGLTRSLGPTFKKLHGISVNCIVPGFVVTGITIRPLVAVIPKQHVTPMETMMKGFDVLLDDEERTGAVLEVSIDKVYFRDPVGYVDESMRWLVEDSAEFFARAFGQSA
jgi:15-hydroxyprostaglandin dehydrogenase (NAD)